MKKILIGLLMPFAMQGSFLVGNYESFSQVDSGSLTRQKCELYKNDSRLIGKVKSWISQVKWDCDFVNEYLKQREKEDNYLRHGFDPGYINRYLSRYVPFPVHTPLHAERQMLKDALGGVLPEYLKNRGKKSWSI